MLLIISLLSAGFTNFVLLFAAGWWLVENADKQIAWFPASYLEQISAHKDIQNVESSDEEGEYGSVPRQQLWFPDHTLLILHKMGSEVSLGLGLCSWARILHSFLSIRQHSLLFAPQAACTLSCGPTRHRKQMSSLWTKAWWWRWSGDQTMAGGSSGKQTSPKLVWDEYFPLPDALCAHRNLCAPPPMSRPEESLSSLLLFPIPLQLQWAQRLHALHVPPGLQEPPSQAADHHEQRAPHLHTQPLLPLSGSPAPARQHSAGLHLRGRQWWRCELLEEQITISAQGHLHSRPGVWQLLAQLGQCTQRCAELEAGLVQVSAWSGAGGEPSPWTHLSHTQQQLSTPHLQGQERLRLCGAICCWPKLPRWSRGAHRCPQGAHASLSPWDPSEVQHSHQTSCAAVSCLPAPPGPASPAQCSLGPHALHWGDPCFQGLQTWLCWVNAVACTPSPGSFNQGTPLLLTELQ